MPRKTKRNAPQTATLGELYAPADLIGEISSICRHHSKLSSALEQLLMARDNSENLQRGDVDAILEGVRAYLQHSALEWAGMEKRAGALYEALGGPQ